MSLQVWLPLINNINNNGVAGPLTQVTAPTFVAGKLGKAMSTGAITIPAATAAKFYNNKAMTFCFWIYPIGTSGSGTIIGQSNMSAGDNRMFTIFQYPTPNDLHLSWQNETATGTFLSGSWNGAFPANTWTHLAVTYDGSTARIYTNGNLLASANGTSARTNFSYNVPIINSSIRYLNDIRIYDDVLSERQIKEIAKGLVVHYPLGNPYEIGKLNKFSGDVSAGLVGPGSFTRTKLANERGYNYKLTRTGTGSSSWPSLGTAAYSFTAGKRYYYSCKVRCHKWTSGSLSLRASRSANDWVTASVQVCNPSLADNKWHEYYTSQIVNATYDRSGTTVTSNPVLEFYSSDQKAEGTLFDMDFDLKDIQVIEADSYQPFTENAFSGNIVSDTSGYNYNGTSNGTLKTNTNTPRYDECTDFAAGPYIALPTMDFSGFANSYTISWWGNYTNTNNTMFWGFINGNRLNLYTSGGNYYWNTGDSGNNPFTVSASAYADGNWHHFAITGNGSTNILYIDGIQRGTAKTYKAITGTQIIINGWDTSTSYDFNGFMSDFRIYATPLSADNIKALYNNPASITDKGTILCNEFAEVLS